MNKIRSSRVLAKTPTGATGNGLRGWWTCFMTGAALGMLLGLTPETFSILCFFPGAGDRLMFLGALALVYGVLGLGVGLFAGTIIFLAARISAGWPLNRTGVVAFTCFSAVWLPGTCLLSITAAGPNYPGVWEATAALTGIAVLSIGAARLRFVPFVGALMLVAGVLGGINLLAAPIGKGEAAVSSGEALSPVQPVKTAVIGWDGATWRIALPLERMGQMPVLGALMAQGVSANLEAYEPMESPELWTTIATGAAPEQHGIRSFFVFRIPGTTAFIREFPPLLSLAEAARNPFDGSYLFPPIPISGALRQRRAIWEQAARAGLAAGVVGWWATWPAEKVRGFMTTDRLIYSRFNMMEAGDRYRTGQTFPATLLPGLLPKVRLPSSLTQPEVDAFMEEPITERPPFQTFDPFTEFELAYAAALTYQAIVPRLVGAFRPDLLAVYFEAIDNVSHFFYKAFQPKDYGEVPPETVAKYGRVIPRTYTAKDRILGEILEVWDGNVVVLCSDHGFQHATPSASTYYLFQKFPTHTGLHHRLGMLVASGGTTMFPWGKRLPQMSLYQVHPLLLHLLGLPLDKSLPSQPPPGELWAKGYLDGKPYRWIETYGRRDASGDSAPESGMDDEITEKLKSLGYMK